MMEVVATVAGVVPATCELSGSTNSGLCSGVEGGGGKGGGLACDVAHGGAAVSPVRLQ